MVFDKSLHSTVLSSLAEQVFQCPVKPGCWKSWRDRDLRTSPLPLLEYKDTTCSTGVTSNIFSTSERTVIPTWASHCNDAN